MSIDTAVLDEVMEAELPSTEAAAASSILGGSREHEVSLPSWFRAGPDAAWETFQTLPRPTRKHQLWRFSNVDALELSSYQNSQPLRDSERAEILERAVVYTGLERRGGIGWQPAL